MFIQLDLRQRVLKELKRCERLYRKLANLLQQLPKGSLLNRNGHIYHAFRENNIQHQRAIKEDKKLLEKLRLRHFIKKMLPPLKARIDACTSFLEKEQLYDPIKINEMVKEVYKGGLCAELFLEGDISEDDWKQEKYRRNPAPMKAKHYTADGQVVRSKAEAMFGTEMESREMLYRLEPEFWINGKYVYPDFEVFLPNTRRRIYIEHFGRMDDPDYLKKVMFKLAYYHEIGLYMGVNFFFTWETEAKPLTMVEIQKLLDTIQALDS